MPAPVAMRETTDLGGQMATRYHNVANPQNSPLEGRMDTDKAAITIHFHEGGGRRRRWRERRCTARPLMASFTRKYVPTAVKEASIEELYVRTRQ